MNKELQEKLILKLLDLNEGESAITDIGESFINKVCMIRTYSAGVHFGTLISRKGKECLLSMSRRVYYWSGACSLSQLAIDGSNDIENCKISKKLEKILLTEVIEIIPMTCIATTSLYGAKEWKK